MRGARTAALSDAIRPPSPRLASLVAASIDTKLSPKKLTPEEEEDEEMRKMIAGEIDAEDVGGGDLANADPKLQRKLSDLDHLTKANIADFDKAFESHEEEKEVKKVVKKEEEEAKPKKEEPNKGETAKEKELEKKAPSPAPAPKPQAPKAEAPPPKEKTAENVVVKKKKKGGACLIS